MTQPQPAQSLDLDTIQARHHLALDPDACGTCRRNVSTGKPAEHEQCNRRAMLLPAPDHIDLEDLADVPEDERAQLPARFHTPVFDGDGEPNSWLCAVCWGDGWVTRWPCATATEKGREVFTAAHHGERARWDGERLIARVRELQQQLDTVSQWVTTTHHGAAAAEVGVIVSAERRLVQYCGYCGRPHLDCTC